MNKLTLSVAQQYVEARSRKASTPQQRELVEMEELLKGHGYNPTDAKKLQGEGMGTFELEHILKTTHPGQMGSLEYTHNFHKKASAASVLRRVAAKWDGKIVGKDFRLQWSDHQWQLEELPQKGKKKLRVAEYQNAGRRYGLDPFIPQNILQHAKVTSSDTYDHVKQKIAAAMEAATEEVITNQPDKKWDFLRQVKWYENEVYFTKVMPEGMEDFTAEGQDFSVSVGWTSFKAYSPDSDFQQQDPHYTLYEASSPGAARKLYQMLKENPNLLKSVPWGKFSDWLREKKVGYSTHFSQWH